MTDRPSVHTLSVSRTARYATLGQPNSASVWWVVLHGYGQLAADFIQAFESIATSDRCVVAPEGLSRFYVDDMDEHERVGASWMTREARDDEISDYVAALDAIVHDLGSGPRPSSIHALGFSQGAATASRWALLGETSIDRLTLWGGGPAHDLDLETHADELERMDLSLVVGEQDPHVTEERRQTAIQRLESYQIPVTVHSFDGGHRLDRPTLRALTTS